MNENRCTNSINLKLDPLWFSDIKIEQNFDLTEYHPIIENNIIDQTRQKILNRFGNISGIKSENEFIENNLFLKINHWIKGKKMNFIFKLTKNKSDFQEVSIFVPEKFTRSNKFPPNLFKKYFKYIINIED